jgi:hypothetical protein
MNVSVLEWASEPNVNFDIPWKRKVFVRNILQEEMIEKRGKDVYLYEKYGIKPYDKFLLTIYVTTNSWVKELEIHPIKVNKRGKEIVQRIEIPYFEKEKSIFRNTSEPYINKYFDYYFEALFKIFTEEYGVPEIEMNEVIDNIKLRIKAKEYESIPDTNF